jgi:hypothetical protein
MSWYNEKFNLIYKKNFILIEALIFLPQKLHFHKWNKKYLSKIITDITVCK